MTQDTPELTVSEVLPHTVNPLQEHLPLHADGYKCTTADLFNILVGGAANKGTLDSVCADLVGTPDPQTSRGYFNEQLCVEELPELEKPLNAALVAEVPCHLGGHTQEVAIDYQDRPYYGKGEQVQALWVRGKAKDGTPRF